MKQSLFIVYDQLFILALYMVHCIKQKEALQMTANCPWPGEDPLMLAYHNEEWGVPNKEDRYLFELLTLEGAQAGLSWKIVLNKREYYRKAFQQFDIDACAKLTDKDLEQIKDHYPIVKHMAKIRSVRKNAQAIQQIQKEVGSFSHYLWTYVDHQPIINQWDSMDDVPTQTDLSVKLSKDLKKRGFSFVGPVILYSYLQAVGIVNDHLSTCEYHPFHT